MDKYFKSQKELLENIIAKKGDCISADWCIMCPLSSKCVFNAISTAHLLPKEDRVRLAYEILFDDEVEEELNEEDI